MEDILDRIAHGISNLENLDSLKKLIDEALESKVPVLNILEQGLRNGINKVGQKYEAGEYFLSELLFGASLIEDAMRILAPRLKAENPETIGSIVLGTVRGDIHDIGKNIFKMLAEASGFEVYDLGVDVEPQDFLKMVKEKKPDVLGLSALLTTTLSEIKAVAEELKKGGIRDQVNVLIGGNAVTKEFGEEAGIDAVAFDAVEGVNICRRWASK